MKKDDLKQFAPRPDEFVRPSKVGGWTLLLVAFLGALGGLGGAALALRYLPEFRPRVFELNRSPEALAVPNAPSLAIEEAYANLVFFVAPKPRAEFLGARDRIGLGLALTSDGLVATTLGVNPASLPLATNFFRSLFDVESVKGKDGKIARDSRLGITFLKVKGANLKVVPFAAPDEVAVGDLAISFGKDGITKLHPVLGSSVRLTSADLIESSEKLTRFVQVAGELDEGVPVYTSKGKLLGVSLTNGMVLPAELIEAALSGFVKKGIITRPYLGVHGIDLSMVTPLSEGLPKNGFLIQGDAKVPALETGGPGQAAGLKEGDIILAIEGERLSQVLPLQLLLVRYPSGTEIILTVLRAGREEKVKVVLGEK